MSEQANTCLADCREVKLAYLRGRVDLLKDGVPRDDPSASPAVMRHAETKIEQLATRIVELERECAELREGLEMRDRSGAKEG